LTQEIAELELLDDVDVEDSNESEDTLGRQVERAFFVSRRVQKSSRFRERSDAMRRHSSMLLHL
jgi:hypothetical protein